MKSLQNFKSLEVANAEEIKGGSGCVFNPVTPPSVPISSPPTVCLPAPIYCVTPPVTNTTTKKTKKTKKTAKTKKKK